MLWFSRVAAVAFIVALPVFLITSNVRLLAGEEQFYERGFRRHDSADRTGLPLTELDRAAKDIIAYFEDNRARLNIVVNDNGDEVALFSTKEVQHMEDVKGLMRAVFRMNEISLAYLLTYVVGVFLWAGAGSMRRLALQCLGGIGVGVGVVVLVGAFALTGFESTWRKFHEIAFSNDLWQLDPDTDRLIQMFPEPFWEESTYILAAVTLGEALLVVVASLALLVFYREKAPGGPGVASVVRIRAADRA